MRTCYIHVSVPLNGWERWDWGPVAGDKKIGVAVAVAVAPPFLRFWEATPTHTHWLLRCIQLIHKVPSSDNSSQLCIP